MSENSILHETVCDDSFEAQFKRVFEAAECKTQSALAELLEIKQSSISDAKRRKAVPSDWLVKLYEKRRINPEWIRMGQGGKLLQAVDEAERQRPVVVNAIERRPAEECTTDELLAEIMRRALKSIS